jgi:phosphate uptake regulator
MKRKLIQHGISSLTVSLPRKWVKENNLKKGEEIEVEELDSQIIISTEKHYKKNKIELNVSGLEGMIRRIVGAAFKSGYDEIKINFETHEELKSLKELMRYHFSGFEIIEQTKNYLVIKNVSQSSFEEFDNVLRRFYLIINSMTSETSEAVNKEDFVWLKNISLMKIESDRASDYCRRAINSSFRSNFKRTAPLYTIIEQLEKTTDKYKELDLYLVENKLTLKKDLKDIIQDISKFQELFYHLFYKFDISNMSELLAQKDKLQKKLNSSIKNCNKEEIEVIIILNNIINLIFNLNGPLMAVYI